MSHPPLSAFGLDPAVASTLVVVLPPSPCHMVPHVRGCHCHVQQAVAFVWFFGFSKPHVQRVEGFSMHLWDHPSWDLQRVSP